MDTLLQNVEKGDVLMTQGNLDKKIASKCDNKTFQSNITFTKPKVAAKGKSKATTDVKKVFSLHNPSALSSLPPKTRVAKAKKVMHPGNAAHLHWTKLKFCQFCNYGVTSKRARARMCVCLFVYSEACRFDETPNNSKPEMYAETDCR